ncbi:efflux RND transporter periplasmic adaptor subunit [Vibrio sp.]|uniref:efflux RND transporter periplasmic adaptor subunit n=1 Tax=Vibrio sp. TaxID=678 RepID=UPI00257DC793|nr:efflux RND transporter periplasmic adaptor subunit [Vibrio sp.]
MMKKSMIAVSLMISLFLVGCGKAEQQQSGAAALKVVIQPVETIEHQPSKAFVGRVSAVEDVDITAQVSGYLKERHFREGQIVEKGQLLYSIEPASYEAQVANAKAAVAQAQATLKHANNEFARAKTLLPKGSISRSEYDNRQAQQMGASAQLEAAKAQLKLAEVNLSYTQITAPFSGRIADSKVSTGDLVSPASGVLTTLVSLDPVHASFQLSERDRLEVGAENLQGDGQSGHQSVKVKVLLENNEVHPHTGQLDFIDNRIDMTTGTIAVRASVPNPDYTLLPGQHINVEISTVKTQPAFVIPRRAVQTDVGGDFVMVVTEGNIAERRDIELGVQTNDGIIVTTGLAENDRVIVSGLQRVRNGMAVQYDNADDQEKAE